MKSLILLITWFGFTINLCLSQSFINGDFETNTSIDCDYNLTDSVFNTKISNVTAFGKGFAASSGGFVGEADLQTTGCFVNPQSGNWCVGLSSDTLPTSDAITIELTTNLIAGNEYELSFYIFGNPAATTLSDIQVGETLSDTLFGTVIDSITPDNNIWKHVSLIFIATQNSSHISVRTKIGTAGWTQVDNFTISPMASVGEHEYKSNLIVYPNPANTYVNIDLQETISSGSASIINLSGQVLTTSEINYTENIHLDLRTIPSGVYFIRIESELFSDFVKFIKK